MGMRNGKDRSGSDDSNNDHSDNGNKSSGGGNNNDNFIKVVSFANIGTEDRNYIQALDIKTRFHANIDEINQKFFFNVDIACGTNEMLSTQ